MTDLNPGWLLGAAVNIGLIAGYIVSLWASFWAAERILGFVYWIRRTIRARSRRTAKEQQ